MIRLEQARVLLLAAMETQGRDFKYIQGTRSGCYYEPVTKIKVGSEYKILDKDDNRCKTGCLIGVALTLAGEARHLGFPEGVIDLHKAHQGMMSEAACEYFSVAQKSQDVGYSWGASYDKAEDWANRFVARNPDTD